MMINPLVIPTLIIAVLLFFAGQKSVSRCRSRTSQAALSVFWFLLGIPGFLMVVYYFHWFDSAEWFYIFRSYPGSELLAAGAGLFAGALNELFKGNALFSKPVLIVLLCLGIVGPHSKPIMSPLSKEQFIDKWRDDVCMQSTPSSCGAASAATIFNTFGIHVTERDIADECLTTFSGTENWYIARAFRKRGLSVRYRIESTIPVDLKLPAIAGVRVGNYGHFIAILKQENGNYVTGDPLVGRKQIPIDRIASAFRFTGFFMEIQSPETNET